MGGWRKVGQAYSSGYHLLIKDIVVESWWFSARGHGKMGIVSLLQDMIRIRVL